jgi:single-strand DNA-binding protein
MSKDLNLCQFIGRLGKDPETRMMPNGQSVVNCTLAVGDDYKDKAGNKVEQTEWIRVIAFGKLADVIVTYCTKGTKIYVSGKMKTRSYEKDNQTVYATEIVASEMQLLDSRNGGPAAAQSNAPTQRNQQSAPANSQPQSHVNDGFGFDDTDLPFMTYMKGYEHLV